MKPLLHWERVPRQKARMRVYEVMYDGTCWRLSRFGDRLELQLMGPNDRFFLVHANCAQHEGPDWPTKAKQWAESLILTPAEMLLLRTRG
jgi:hypothetical protein